jgi:hypothetical protein
MTSSILQGGLLNTTKEEGVLSQSSRSSARGRCLGGIMFFFVPQLMRNTFFYSRTRGDFRREVFNYLVILFPTQLFSLYCSDAYAVFFFNYLCIL